VAETLVLSGDKITGAIAKFQSKIKKSWRACVDSSIPAFSMSGAIRKGYSDAKMRGVRIRYVTEITKENLQHCKELMQFAELRHLDGVRGSFAVSESEFVAGISPNGSIEKLVYSNVAEMVEHQQQVFETLWGAGAPAERKIQELS
jgi:hypothetical protein